MKALVIGGGGFVGPYLVRHLTDDCGYEVTVTNSWKEISLFQPSFASALAGLPIRSSTSAGLKKSGLTLSTTLN